MNAEIKEHHAVMDKMMGDDFKAFSQTAGRGKEWKELHDGHFNTIRSVLAPESLPEIGKRDWQGSKFSNKKPKGALEHDVCFKPGGTGFGKMT